MIFGIFRCYILKVKKIFLLQNGKFFLIFFFFFNLINLKFFYLIIILSQGSDETRKVTHFWFTSWPDHNVPKKCHQVVSLVKEVNSLQRQQGAPLVVHCRLEH